MLDRAASRGAAPTSEGGPTPILVWTGVKGEAEVKLAELVEQYNASQDDYVVETQFSGTGDQLPAKLLNAVQNDQGPNMQLGDSTPQMLAPAPRDREGASRSTT